MTHFIALRPEGLATGAPTLVTECGQTVPRCDATALHQRVTCFACRQAKGWKDAHAACGRWRKDHAKVEAPT